MATGTSTAVAVIAALLLTGAAITGWTAYYFEIQAAKQHHRQAEDTQAQLSGRVANLQATYKTLRQGYGSLQRRHRALRANSTRLEGTLAGSVAERDDLNLRLNSARSEHTHLTGELNTMLSERNQLNAQLDTARDAQDKLRAEIEANSEEVRAKEAELEDTYQRAEEMSAQRDRLQARLDATASVQADLRTRLQANDARIKTKEAELQNSQHRIKVLTTDLERANARIVELAQQLDAEKQARLRESERFARLKTELETELQSKEVQIEQLRDDFTLIRVGGDILFNVGSTELRPTGARALRLIADVLKEFPERDVSLEGHTDALPIGEMLSAMYPTNWELSAARAARAVRFLQTEAGVDPRRLRVVGYGEHQPVVPNRPEDMARNRRIEILLLPRNDHVAVAPAQVSGSAPADPAIVDQSSPEPMQAPVSQD